jgi:DUF1680 family protein
VQTAGGFCRIRKTWQKGDLVTLTFSCHVEPLVACNGQVAIQRGSLLYSLPIATKRKVLSEYDVAGLADIAMTPAEEVPEYSIDPDNLDFRQETNAREDMSRPWHSSPIILKGSLHDAQGQRQEVTLVPFGCTTLRRTAFESGA